MSSLTGPPRAPGSFSPSIPQSTTGKRPPLRHVESSDSSEELPTLALLKNRPSPQHGPTPPRPFYAQSHANSSTGSLQNFSRPTTGHSRGDLPLKNDPAGVVDTSWERSHRRKYSQPQSVHDGSILSSHNDFFRGHGRKSSSSSQLPTFEGIADSVRGHSRKHSQTQGSFEPYLPTAANSSYGAMANANGLNASAIAAQAAMQQQSHHARQRSQTVPAPNIETTNTGGTGSRRPSKGPHSPPVLSLTEASGPREGLAGQSYHGMMGAHQNAAQAAANVVFSKSPSISPNLGSQEFDKALLEKALPEKPKTEKSKVKLFSRPGKIGISKDKDPRNTGLPSPNKLGQYTMASLQKMNMSTTSVADSNLSSASSMYSLANSSSATIRAVDQPQEKEKEKHKHHFLSRQKHKLSSKEDHHLNLSSAASNSRPVDPNAPGLYNFNLPPSPGPSTTSFAKSMSGLDLRHGGRALREKKKEEKSEMAFRENDSSFSVNEWLGPSSLGSVAGTSLLTSYPTSVYGDAPDFAKFGLNNMGPDDAWPYLKAKLLIIFEGEDLRLPVEDFNRLVSTHIQRCIQKRYPNTILEDLRDLLYTGFTSLDATLHRIPDERIIPHLVEMWLFTFTSILPYMQAVFLPLDLEFSGNGPLLSSTQARDVFGSASSELEVRKIVLTAFRDKIILPRFETLKQIFSRLSLDSLALPLPIPVGHTGQSNYDSQNLLSNSPPNDTNSNSNSDSRRPGTATSLDPSLASYSSSNTTLINTTIGGGGGTVAFPPFAPGGGAGNRSRAISNTSTRSDGMMPPPPPPPMRPFTPSSTHPSSGSFGSLGTGYNNTGYSGRERGGSSRERNVLVEHSSNRLTETVGRMLQCVSVLASLGGASALQAAGTGTGNVNGAGGGIGNGNVGEGDEQAKMEELNRALKLNWLGRGRTGRNRRGMVGGRVERNVSTVGAGAGKSVVVN